MISHPFGKDDLFIAPDGKDKWSGRLARPNAGGTDGPLATFVGAQKCLRRLKGVANGETREPIVAGLNRPLTVWVRGGCYEFEKPLVFTPADSAPVTFKAYPREKPVLDGGVRIKGWRKTKTNGRIAWVVDLPEVAEGSWNFRELFVNGERRSRPRLPRRGLFRMKAAPGHPKTGGWGIGGHTCFLCKKGEVREFANLNEVEVVYLHFWIEERSGIKAFDPATNRVTLARESRAPLFGSFGSQLADYYLDNVFEALRNSGEWYLDRNPGRLYYIPKRGETPETAEVYAPRVLQMLVLKGNPEKSQYVEFLRFEGLIFRHTDWRHPDPGDAEEKFHASPGTETERKLRKPTHRRNKAAAIVASWDVPGVIFLEGARHCAIEECTLEHLGWYGIEITDGSWGINVIGNTIRDLGAGGVKINGASSADPRSLRTGNHRVTDNEIHAGGRVFHSAVGILSMNAFSCHLSHNHIHDFYYSGISCGWVWGYGENVSRDNRIEKNHIHDLGQGLLSDMGGIYILGVQSGTVLRGNLIHDIEKSSYGAWCIYLDEGSSHLIVENNVCFRTNETIFNQHYGRENTVRNNIFAFGGEAILSHGRVDPWHRGVSFERNILITDRKPIFMAGFACRLADRNHGSDLNLIWDVSGKPLTFSEGRGRVVIGLEEWRKLGHDRHSIFADPECRDLHEANFTLAENSPAFAIGFQPIDLSDVGPRPKQKR